MDTSTYFGLNLVTGSDKVNPLTVDRPNYEKIDEQMHNNQIASIAEATELKSGTTHAITCLTEGVVFFRFTATSDFDAGDTFTFNGTPVSAVLPDGSGLQQGAFKINGTVLCSIIGTLLTVYSYTASGIAADAEKLGGQLPAYYAKATDAISTYIHSRIGTVNNFVGTGANGKVKFAANIQPGDTVQINGQDVSAFAGATEFVAGMIGQEIVGKTAFFAYDSTSNIVTFSFSGNAAINSGDYSTLPVDTGKKWIDGKTIWRKVVNYTTPSSSNTIYVPVGDTVETFVSIEGFVSSAAAGLYSGTFISNTSGQNVGVSGAQNNNAASDKNSLVIACQISTYFGRPGYAIIEYTRP